MTIKLRIYVATSWKNKEQPKLVKVLRDLGHEVYDFRHDGFEWDMMGKRVVQQDGVSIKDFLDNIESDPAATSAFQKDKAALDWCNVCVMVLPCGKSAHLEAGYAAGQGKHVLFYLAPNEGEELITPELMYLMGDGFCTTWQGLSSMLFRIAGDNGRHSYTNGL